MSTQSQINHQAYEIARAYDIMSASPDAQKLERIARHYLGFAAHAQQALKMVEMTTLYPEMLTEDNKRLLLYLLDQFKRGHAYDLGLELEWPEKHPHFGSTPLPINHKTR